MDSRFLGYSVGRDQILISPDHSLNKKTGLVRPIANVDFSSDEWQDVVINDKAEYVTGIDGKKIEFLLANSNGEFPSANGFLIEVYLSGADGKLTRVYQEDRVDFLSNENLSDGFSNYLVLEVDKE